jgi:hypothetical protein
MGTETSTMDDMAIRELLRRHGSDIENQDRVHEIIRDDVVLEFPQGNERLVGLANVRGMRESYPATVSAIVERMRGHGNLWVTELILTYACRRPTHAVNIMEWRDGKVAHETIYFGEPWERPAWRAVGGVDRAHRRAIAQWRNEMSTSLSR